MSKFDCLPLFHTLQFHENSSFHSKNCMHFFWNKNHFFIIVLQLYDVIFNLNAKRCTKPPKKLLLLNLLADFCHYKLYRWECKISYLQLQILRIIHD